MSTMLGWKVKANPASNDHFERVASVYDETIHNDEHELSLRLISAYIERLNLTSILDVGTGTGRGLQYFLSHHPTMRVYGIEPIDAMREQAILKGVPAALIGPGVGERLPFPDHHFDAVTAFGIMHHAERPADVVREMMRVSKRAIFISDSNRYGQGSKPSRLLKLAAYQLGFWPLLYYVHTRGRNYQESEGDGRFHSYSPYDDLHQISKWAKDIALIPIKQESTSSTMFNPLLTASHILLCALA